MNMNVGADGTVVIAISLFPKVPGLILKTSKGKVISHSDNGSVKSIKSLLSLEKRFRERVAIDCHIKQLVSKKLFPNFL